MKRPAADRAGAAGDDHPGLGHGLVGGQQGGAHVAGDRPGDVDAVGVARRGDEVDAEAGQVEKGRVEHVGVRLAGVAAAGRDLAELQRAAEQPLEMSLGVRRQFGQAAVGDQVLAPGRAQLEAIGEADKGPF